MRRVFAAAAALLAASAPLGAFVYSEHRTIAGAAIAELDEPRAAVLRRLWGLARTGFENRLCPEPWTGVAGLSAPCIDLASWSALGGDHSCSPDQLLTTVLESAAVWRKAEVAAREQRALESARRDDQRRNAAARAQVALARIDPEYASRAGANTAHFLLGRRGEGMSEYIVISLDAANEPNSAATFFLFHGAAMILAARTDPDESGPEAAARARRILALEAFAEHFLEDMFASGHVAGSWGNRALRKGTHDYYNRNGLEVRSWDGTEAVLFGDAFLKLDGLALAARAVRESLSQVLDAWTPGSPTRSAALEAAGFEEAVSGRYNVCAARSAPHWDVPDSLVPAFEAIARRMPVPFHGEGPGSLPRYHAEIGPFAGLIAGGGLGGASGFDEVDTGGQAIGSLLLGLRFGLGLEQLLTDGGDGLIFLEGGVVMASKEPSDCPEPECAAGLASLLPSVPARTGLEARLRMPFWVIPGDLLLAAPILALTSPDTLVKMAAVATNGGLIPWQTKFHTPAGHFQLIFGREVAATFFGFAGGDDAVVFLEENDGEIDPVIVGMRSIALEVPILEWEPFRTYAAKQTLGLRFQFGAGFDIPMHVRVLEPPGAAPPTLQTRYFAFLRLVFEGRRYF